MAAAAAAVAASIPVLAHTIHAASYQAQNCTLIVILIFSQTRNKHMYTQKPGNSFVFVFCCCCHGVLCPLMMIIVTILDCR